MTQISKSVFITDDETQDLVGLKRVTLVALAEKGRFPQFRRVAERTVVWVRSEVESWIRDRLADDHSQAVLKQDYLREATPRRRTCRTQPTGGAA